jgi:alpha-L-fucosidase
MRSVKLLRGGESEAVEFEKRHGWTRFRLPPTAPEKFVSVIELELAGVPQADPVWGIDPEIPTEIQAEFATVRGAKQEGKRWMEKFGEWKHVVQVTDWETEGAATWEVDVLAPGDYQVDLTYAGEGRLVWGVTVEGGQSIQNQQNASHNYQRFPIGWLQFPQPGRYNVNVSCLEGNTKTASLKSIRFAPIP